MDIDAATVAEPAVWYSLNKRKRWMHMAQLTDGQTLRDEKRLVTTRVSVIIIMRH